MLLIVENHGNQICSGSLEEARSIPAGAHLRTSGRRRPGHAAAVRQPSMIATALVQPAEARSILTGKHDTMKPVDGNCSRLCSFSMWQ
jgi:hypothetical protein